MSTAQCKIKENVPFTGRIGTIYHNHIIIDDGTIWSVVLWVGDNEPVMFRTRDLLVAKPSWVEAKDVDLRRLVVQEIL